MREFAVMTVALLACTGCDLFWTYTAKDAAAVQQDGVRHLVQVAPGVKVLVYASVLYGGLNVELDFENLDGVATAVSSQGLEVRDASGRALDDPQVHLSCGATEGTKLPIERGQPCRLHALYSIEPAVHEFWRLWIPRPNPALQQLSVRFGGLRRGTDGTPVAARLVASFAAP